MGWENDDHASVTSTVEIHTRVTFINQIIDHLVHNGTMDPADLFKPPFTDLHDQGLLGVLPQLAQAAVQTIRRINENALVA